MIYQPMSLEQAEKDVIGLDAALKSNLESLWFFDKETIWYEYVRLTKQQALVMSSWPQLLIKVSDPTHSMHVVRPPLAARNSRVFLITLGHH
ncbi:MAG: hypothetical protein EZS28_009651 [Streblomastix strix]|uniref:Uncharacterized protein n=1 Tax=Streblomastix strix TaxID=222440 RepID=A0A5J4WIZ8_9EUKA|nr:MAG: hypothetical protein EZS28_009651 [Streblomastix strix]